MPWPLCPACDIIGACIALETNNGSPDPYRDKEEQPMSMHVPPMTRNAVSHNPGILATKGNSASCAQADGSRNMSSVLTG